MLFYPNHLHGFLYVCVYNSVGVDVIWLCLFLSIVQLFII